MKNKKKEVAKVKATANHTPTNWNIINSLDFILSEAKGSKFCDKFWKSCAAPLSFLEKELNMTKVQIVFLAIMVEHGEPISWRGFGEYIGCSRLSIMTYSEEFEELLSMGWVSRKGVFESRGQYQGFRLEYGVVTALRHNTTFKPKKFKDLNIQEFVDRLEAHIDSVFNFRDWDLEEQEDWLLRLCKANSHLPLCSTLLSFDDMHVQSLLLLIVYDYAQFEGSSEEGFSLESINAAYPLDLDVNYLRKKLINNTHPLIKAGLVEQKCEEGIADSSRFLLTQHCKDELLTGYEPSHSKCNKPSSNKRILQNHENIKTKSMFYNNSEQEQITKLIDLLNQDNLPTVQQRLERAGLRKGFACLFYGAPGTGKTETVLQIARQTGRDIMQVDIAGMRNKYVGESEKNIKSVFNRYRNICKECDVMPILFFNEADALINKRTENIEHSVDKMDNAMQNIILQELENLDGILIATTNLTSNLDNAFERRFLFKIEFNKPNNEVKAKLWRSMINDISEEDASYLASNYDLSGGQIENVARKYTINRILSDTSSSLLEIENYCKAELQLNHTRQRVGFC